MADKTNKTDKTEEKPEVNEEIIVDLKSKDENAAVSNLSKDEQDKIKVISDKLREELGIDEDAANGTQQTEQEANQQTEQLSEKDVFSGFIKKYSKKDENIESMSAGKYDSDLDFKINRKIKRVHLPLPKKTKIILSAVAGVVAVGLISAVAVMLYKPPVPVTLSSVAITQPLDVTKRYYVVSNVNVGDKVNFANIYLNCKYSDGSTKRIKITSSMATLATNSGVQNGRFVKTGAVDYRINYQGKTLDLRFMVTENLPYSLSAFPANFDAEGNNCLQVNKTAGAVDITNRLVIKCTYDDGTIKQVDLSQCKFAINSSVPSKAKYLDDNMLEYSAYAAGTSTVYVYYEETLANGSTNRVSCTFNLKILNA